MPRILAIDPRVPTSHGVIIRRHTVEEQTRAYTTVAEARAYARRTVKEAQIQAESIKKQAMQQGFSDGWQDSLTIIAQSLREMEQLHTQIENTLKQSVHKALETALEHPALELQLIEGWLAAAPRTPATLHLVLPRRAQAQSSTIVRRLEEALKITPTISIGENDHIVIECGDQVFEFSPTRTLQELDDLAQDCLQRIEVKKQCAAWNTHIVQHWLTSLAQRHNCDLPATITVDMIDNNKSSSVIHDIEDEDDDDDDDDDEFDEFNDFDEYDDDDEDDDI